MKVYLIFQISKYNLLRVRMCGIVFFIWYLSYIYTKIWELGGIYTDMGYTKIEISDFKKSEFGNSEFN